jgi:hypothetical protein
MVENGLCVIGSIAAALQVKFGYSAATAISKATEALQAEGVTTTPVNGGIYVDGEDMESALISLGFTLPDIVHSATNIAAHFNDGGFGIGHFSGPPGHDVFLTGYSSSTNQFHYYDSVTGNYHYGGGLTDIILYFN